MELRPRFDLHLNDEVKKFLWIATLLDPRFKKLDCFKGLGCEDLIGSKQRTRVAAWLRIEYDKNYKNHVSAPTEASGPASHAAGSSASGTTVHRPAKARDAGQPRLRQAQFAYVLQNFNDGGDTC
tara:strand:- start:91 stop:465 length:375 start_codon:yes stop_codon:yes gene_type:complete